MPWPIGKPQAPKRRRTSKADRALAAERERVAQLERENAQLHEKLRVLQEENEFSAAALARMNLHMQSEAIAASIRRDGYKPKQTPEATR